MNACLDGPALAQLADDLSGTRARVIEEHLDACEDCRALVAAYAQVATDASGDEPTRLASTVASPEPAKGDDARAPFVAEPGVVLGGRYVLERVIGEGGMGVVWAARDAHDGPRVAIKLLKGGSNDLFRRFERETRIASRLVHPNIVEVQAVLALPDGAPALVMDLLDGHSLATELAERGAPLAPDETRAILLPLVDAVRAAHARGILHRDLKPANVFLAKDTDGTPVVTLLDFGLAKLLAKDDEAEGKLTRTGTMLGTPRYMAPEQLLGEAASAASDVWAVGAIAFECLTGDRPVDGKSLAQLVREVTRGNVKRLPVGLPLKPVVDAMLSVDAVERPSLSEVYARLRTTTLTA